MMVTITTVLLAALPAGYVVTPSGLAKHVSCVPKIPSGSRVERQANGYTWVFPPNPSPYGAPYIAYPPCAYPDLDANGNTIGVVTSALRRTDTAAVPPPYAIDNWLAEQVISLPGSGLPAPAYIGGVTVVPPAPMKSNGQAFFDFIGFSTSDNLCILQPVVGYQDGQWQMIATKCCRNEACPEVTSPVNPGDIIWRYVWGSQCSTATGVCATWTISLYDLMTGKTINAIGDSGGQTIGTIHANVVETYYMYDTSCDEMPGAPGLHSTTQGPLIVNSLVDTSGTALGPEMQDGIPWVVVLTTNLCNVTAEPPNLGLAQSIGDVQSSLSYFTIDWTVQ